ncbi:MAG: radical SAM protein [Coriobacteriales bacterium]|jgi:anaerobic ribonucleoside-triphosphate reductase activating protein|nr:radical SAM protein [Coriobacteriales bacterium]
MQIEVARVLSPVESLGPGKRLALWLQGCAIAQAGSPCGGCISRDLWVSGHGRCLDTYDFGREVTERVHSEELSGLTVTGGEPLDQYDALLALVGAVKSELLSDHDSYGQSNTFDLLLFTHYTQSEIATGFPDIMEAFDAMVCGEYRADLPSETPLIGSTNQELIVKPIVANKYSTLSQQPRLQAFVVEGDVLFTGIPLTGEVEAIAHRLESRGVTFESVSWKGAQP